MADNPQNPNQNQGLVQSLLADMPPTAKALVSFFLVVPISLAISGMILNVNVGSIIQDVVTRSLDGQQAAMDAALDARFIALQQSLDAAMAQSAEQFLDMQLVLDGHATRLEEHSQRITVLERAFQIEARRPPLPSASQERP